MGKKRNKTKAPLPLVSVCTPTYNRRPFISSMIQCFQHQTYPADRMEWIVIDDGTDKVGDLLVDIPQVKYYAYDEKMPLGKKRNEMHSKSTGAILVYMDDDDYYPPERVEHAVQRLRSNSKALCAGSSEIHVHFKHIDKIIQFGPYGAQHATAGTFAFKRELLRSHRYDDDAALAEEKSFLENYTVPFVQLDTLKTILVFSHNHNTFDKRRLLDNPHPNYVRDSRFTVDDFVKESDLQRFFTIDIESALENYAPGRPEMKPDVLDQMVKIEEERRKMAEQRSGGQIVVQRPDGSTQSLNPQEVTRIMSQQQEQLHMLSEALRERDFEIKELKKELQFFRQSKRDVERAKLRMSDNIMGTLRREINA